MKKFEVTVRRYITPWRGDKAAGETMHYPPFMTGVGGTVHHEITITGGSPLGPLSIEASREIVEGLVHTVINGGLVPGEQNAERVTKRFVWRMKHMDSLLELADFDAESLAIMLLY